EVLTRHALNRAALERQGLLRRWTIPVSEAIERLIGLQSQLPDPPYIGLWTRLEGFRRDTLTWELYARQVVRSTMMRYTLHLRSEVLTRHALNRAALERQGLLRRWTIPVSEAIERLIGLQSQLPDPPYIGLWTRLEGFRRDTLTWELYARQVVRSTMMRYTLHL